MYEQWALSMYYSGARVVVMSIKISRWYLTKRFIYFNTYQWLICTSGYYSVQGATKGIIDFVDTGRQYRVKKCKQTKLSNPSFSFHNHQTFYVCEVPWLCPALLVEDIIKFWFSAISVLSCPPTRVVFPKDNFFWTSFSPASPMSHEKWYFLTKMKNKKSRIKMKNKN